MTAIQYDTLYAAIELCRKLKSDTKGQFLYRRTVAEARVEAAGLRCQYLKVFALSKHKISNKHVEKLDLAVSEIETCIAQALWDDAISGCHKLDDLLVKHGKVEVSK